MDPRPDFVLKEARSTMPAFSNAGSKTSLEPAGQLIDPTLKSAAGLSESRIVLLNRGTDE